jgi:hypothetical protein
MIEIHEYEYHVDQVALGSYSPVLHIESQNELLSAPER